MNESNSRQRRTVAQALGTKNADALARWAIDVLCNGETPADQNQHAWAAKVPWTLIHEGRGILEAAGVDWREIHSRERAAVREAQRRTDDERRRRRRAEQDRGAS